MVVWKQTTFLEKWCKLCTGNQKTAFGFKNFYLSFTVVPLKAYSNNWLKDDNWLKGPPTKKKFKHLAESIKKQGREK